MSDDDIRAANESAQEFKPNGHDKADDGCDPLEDLVERVVETPNVAFRPEVLARLAALKKENLGALEALRARLKKAGVRVTALDEAMAAADGGARPDHPPKQADVLIDLAESADLFHAPDGTCYADVRVGDHRETWPVRSRGFNQWLACGFFEATKGAPNTEALRAALAVIEARARFDGPRRAVHVRVAGHDGRLYLDLANDRWQAVEIGPTGWRVVDDPPVRFRRPAGMLPLPTPTRGGSVDALRPFLNVRRERDFVLVVAWALAVLRDRGPYPVLVLSGEQGSAKSTFAAMLRALLDPNCAPLRALPREERDLFIAATNGHLLTFDNVSGLPPWISDTLCRLATGGGFAVRQLYTDGDEVLFDAARPALLNGIEDVVTRPDLADRALFLALDPIPDSERKPETELRAAFEAARPGILGALLDAAAHGLEHLPETHLDHLPRMADFALWATACEGALWAAGTFGAAYAGNRDDAVDNVIEADPVGSAVRAFMAERTTWTGTASALLGALGAEAGDVVRRAKTWPATPNTLSGRLRRAATCLRKVGIAVEFHRDESRSRTRTITLRAAAEEGGNFASAPSASSAPPESPVFSAAFDADAARTQEAPADASAGTAGGAASPTVRTNPLIPNAADEADGADANIPSQSGSPKGNGGGSCGDIGWEADL